MTSLILLISCIGAFMILLVKPMTDEHFKDDDSTQLPVNGNSYMTINPYLSQKQIKRAVDKAHQDGQKMQFYLQSKSNKFPNKHYTDKNIQFSTTDALMEFLADKKGEDAEQNLTVKGVVETKCHPLDINSNLSNVKSELLELGHVYNTSRHVKDAQQSVDLISKSVFNLASQTLFEQDIPYIEFMSNYLLKP